MPKVIVNGPLTAIEIRSDEEIDAIRARYGIFFNLNKNLKYKGTVHTDKET